MADVSMTDVSDATCSVIYVGESIYPDHPSASKVNRTPVTKLTFNMNLADVLANTNFSVENSQHGSQSHR